MQELLENKIQLEQKTENNSVKTVVKGIKKKKNFFEIAYRTKFYKACPYTFYINHLYTFKYFMGFRKHLSIKLSSNNVFCTLKNLKHNTVYFSRASGAYKMKVTKKSLKYVSSLILYSFLEQNKINFKNCSLILVLTAPTKLRKNLIKLLYKNLKYKYKIRNLVFCVPSKKSYNGCRAPKKRRKKRRVLQKFK